MFYDDIFIQKATSFGRFSKFAIQLANKANAIQTMEYLHCPVLFFHIMNRFFMNYAKLQQLFSDVFFVYIIEEIQLPKR